MFATCLEAPSSWHVCSKSHYIEVAALYVSFFETQKPEFKPIIFVLALQVAKPDMCSLDLNLALLPRPLPAFSVAC